MPKRQAFTEIHFEKENWTTAGTIIRIHYILKWQDLTILFYRHHNQSTLLCCYVTEGCLSTRGMKQNTSDIPPHILTRMHTHTRPVCGPGQWRAECDTVAWLSGPGQSRESGRLRALCVCPTLPWVTNTDLNVPQSLLLLFFPHHGLLGANTHAGEKWVVLTFWPV